MIKNKVRVMLASMNLKLADSMGGVSEEIYLPATKVPPQIIATKDSLM